MNYILIDIDNCIVPDFYGLTILKNHANVGLIPPSVLDEILSLIATYKSGKLAYVDLIAKWNEIWATSLTGISIKQLKDTDRDINQQEAKRIRPFFKGLLGTLIPRTDTKIILVTGEPTPVAQSFAAAINIQDIIGTELGIDQNNCLTGKVTKGLFDPQDKVDAIFATGIQPDQILAAFGDSISDAGMLKLAKHPFCVCPSQELKALGRTNNWHIIDETAQFSDYAHLFI